MQASDAADALAAWFGERGLLAEALPGYRPRPQQIQLSRAVARAIDERGVLVAEAGTGIGKTFAYLLPALVSGLRAVISTGTRNLQDQLFHRDLPMVRSALPNTVRVALLKGRANYLCLYRLESAFDGMPLESRQAVRDLAAVRQWSLHTRAGDIAEVSTVAEQSPVWPLVTSTVDNCLGVHCPKYEKCHVLEARRAAQEADVVVINHHLLLADMALKEDGFGDLLPGADVFVVDEAHQLPQVAAHFFGRHLSSRQLGELARDSRVEALREAPDMPQLVHGVDALEARSADLRLALGEEGARVRWRQALQQTAVQSATEALRRALEDCATALRAVADRGPGLEQCARRAGELLDAFETFSNPADAADAAVEWGDVHRKSFVLHRTPFDVSQQFAGHMQAEPAAWIFTSATLAVGGDFSHFTQRLGLPEARVLKLDSPFDYARNALLFVPPGLPPPASPQFGDAVLDAGCEAVAASRGRAFFLFTSHRALQYAAARLRGRLAFPILVQGEAPRSELLRRFTELGNAVLLGTGSFWEGVDVRGEALSLVLIDKLPFASPSDPVVEARIQWLQRQGGRAFPEYQLPSAVVSLKQGVGRLIRDVSDRGVLMLCDPRVLTKSYGRLFLDSLPPMPLTRDASEVHRFFTAEGTLADEAP